jgi:hypothetical protein
MNYIRPILGLLFLALTAVGAGCSTSTSGAGGSTTGTTSSGACFHRDEACQSDADCCAPANCFGGYCCKDGVLRNGCFCGDQDAGPPSDGTSLPSCDNPGQACGGEDGGVADGGAACMCVEVIMYTPCP